MKENENIKRKYCLVKYLHWETTNKHLDCSRCPLECEYKPISQGDSINDKSTN